MGIVYSNLLGSQTASIEVVAWVAMWACCQPGRGQPGGGVGRAQVDEMGQDRTWVGHRSKAKIVLKSNGETPHMPDASEEFLVYDKVNREHKTGVSIYRTS